MSFIASISTTVFFVLMDGELGRTGESRVGLKGRTADSPLNSVPSIEERNNASRNHQSYDESEGADMTPVFHLLKY
jgi:hypothetical protein